jgi:hypothetical protein
MVDDFPTPEPGNSESGESRNIACVQTLVDIFDAIYTTYDNCRPCDRSWSDLLKVPLPSISL